MYETQMQDFSHLGNLVYCTLVMWPLDDSLFGQCVVSSIHGKADKTKLAGHGLHVAYSGFDNVTDKISSTHPLLRASAAKRSSPIQSFHSV